MVTKIKGSFNSYIEITPSGDGINIDSVEEFGDYAKVYLTKGEAYKLVICLIRILAKGG